MKENNGRHKWKTSSQMFDYTYKEIYRISVYFCDHFVRLECKVGFSSRETFIIFTINRALEMYHLKSNMSKYRLYRYFVPLLNIKGGYSIFKFLCGCSRAILIKGGLPPKK